MERPSTHYRNDLITQLCKKKLRKEVAKQMNMTIDAVNKVIERRRRAIRETMEKFGKNQYGQFRIDKEHYNKWIRLPNMSHTNLKSVGGCYVIYSNSKPIYVGQSSDVFKRVRDHGIFQHKDDSYYTPWGTYRNVSLKVKYYRKYGEWLAAEARLIKKIKPKHNRRGWIYSH